MAFQGRLKHLQRWGFPTGEKPGKGKAIAYTVEHVFRAVLALELIQAGINPKFAIDIVDSNWGQVFPTVYLNSFTGTERLEFGGGSESDWCWLVRPEALRGLTVEGESEFDKHEAIHPVPAASLLSHLTIDSSSLGSHLGSHWRNLVINGGPLVRGVLGLIELKFGWASRGDLIGNLKDIIDKRNDVLREAMKGLDAELGQIMRKVKADRKARGADHRPYSDLYPSLIPAAEQILAEANDELRSLLSLELGAKVELSNEALRTLADKRLIQISADELAMTPLFFVAHELALESSNGSNT